MKVLIVAMSLDIGGAETHVYNLAVGLKNVGIEPIVVSSGGVYEELLIKKNIKFYNAPLHKKDLKNMVNSYNKLKEIIIKEKIDIVHAHGRIPAFVSRIITNNYRIPFVVTAHAKFRCNLVYKLFSFWGDKTIVISDDLQEYLINTYKVNPTRIVKIENAIDTELFESEKDKIYDNKKIINIGRLDESLGKTCKKLIQVVEELDNKGNSIELNIIGDGSYYNVLKEYINSLKLKNSTINMLGKRTNVHEIIPKHDVAVCVSRAAMECMACNLPVILAGGEGYLGILEEKNISEAINTNLTGRGYYNNLTKENIFNDLSALLYGYDSKKREKMGRFNRKIVEEKYSLKTMIEKTASIYYETMGGNKGANH